MSGRAWLVLGLTSLVAMLASGGCQSEPLEPTAAVGGENAGGPASSPAPEGCPQGDWMELDGKPCAEEDSDNLNCFKVGECSSSKGTYRDERLYCFPSLEPPTTYEWAAIYEEGSCDTSGIVLGPDGCPEGDWSEADGLPCPKEGVECATDSDGCPNDDGFYYDESISCFRGRWFWGFDEGPCCDPSEGGAGSDCG